MSYPPTPELDKMIALRDSGKSGLIEEFLDWLRDGQGYDIVRFDSDGENPRTFYDMERLMSLFFGVDQAAAERERRAVLAWVRSTNTLKNRKGSGYTGDKNPEDTG